MYRLRGADGFELAVEGDRIVEPRAPFALSIDLGPGELRPGFINAHEHLHRNHYPRLGRPPYPDAYVWGTDIHAHDTDTIRRARAVDRREALLFGALKNLLSGVTAAVHHDTWEAAFADRFPLRVLPVRTVHSLGTELARAAAEGRSRAGAPLCMHLAEGTTGAMAEEVREADRLGLLDDRLIAVHLVGVDSAGVDLLARRRVAVAWCPSSNAFLFGRTAPAELLERLDVLIGSDSMLTGAGTLLDELRCARSSGLLEERRILAGVGSTVADRMRIEAPALTPGSRADVVLLGRPPFEATTEDVHLVLVGGLPRVADERYAPLFELLDVQFQRVRVGASERLVAAPLGSVAERILADWPDARRIFALLERA